MLEVILVPFLLDKVTPQFPSETGGDLLSCSEAEQVIESIGKNAASEFQQELIDTIKLSTKPGCYEGSERNS